MSNKTTTAETMTHWTPKPPEIQNDPELATLAILDYTLHLTEYALYAQYPDIHNDDAILDSHTPLLSQIVAREILHQIERLQESIYWYRQRLKEEQDRRYENNPF